MNEFAVRSPDQLPALLQSFRKAAGWTQAETALRLGVTQQTYSSLERHASKVSAERLLRLLNLLGVELVLQAKVAVNGDMKPTEPETGKGPIW